ncbi:MAG: hypothetical protein HY902_19895, partial [Deltaproteobacteria bacterium]|nr:hypothetical protein [Deltaproteobacteria bacterium]
MADGGPDQDLQALIAAIVRQVLDDPSLSAGNATAPHASEPSIRSRALEQKIVEAAQELWSQA